MVRPPGRRPVPLSVPRQQGGDLLGGMICDTCEHVSEPGAGVDVVELASLCRPPNYAEWFWNDAGLSRRQRLSHEGWLRDIRHSLVAQSASKKASRRSFGRKRVCLPRSYGFNFASAVSFSAR